MARAYKQHLKIRVINAFRRCGTVFHACEAVGVDPTTHRDWMQNDPEYAEMFLAANENVTENLENKAMQMAMDGHPALLIFLLKSRKPDVYVERFKHEVQSEQLGRLVGLVTSILRRALTQEQIDRLRPEFDTALESLGSRRELQVVA
jgi:hypothetical protein